jgi:Gpi18-like mannosyltransferase
MMKNVNKKRVKVNKIYIILGAIYLVAFVFRIFIAGTILGHHTDMGCFSYWGEQAYQDGLLEFYNGKLYCDYPPLYIYILWVIEALRELFGIMFAFPAHLIMLKLPSIIFDLISAYFIYKIAKNRFSEKTSVILSALMAFNIAYILNSSAWGQIDSILTFLIMLTAYNIMNNKLQWATVAYVFAVLLKPQALYSLQYLFSPT